jgi:hypothetical protein
MLTNFFAAAAHPQEKSVQIVDILTAAEFFKKLAAVTFDVTKSFHYAAKSLKSCRGQ